MNLYDTVWVGDNYRHHNNYHLYHPITVWWLGIYPRTKEEASSYFRLRLRATSLLINNCITMPKKQKASIRVNFDLNGLPYSYQPWHHRKNESTPRTSSHGIKSHVGCTILYPNLPSVWWNQKKTTDIASSFAGETRSVGNHYPDNLFNIRYISSIPHLGGYMENINNRMRQIRYWTFTDAYANV